MAFGQKKNNEPIAEINVTPLVDVMLVLLIIFMVTAPLMLNGISLELPKTKENNNVSSNSKMVILTFSKDMQLFIGKRKIKFSSMNNELKNALLKNGQDTIFLRADKEIRYGSVARLMSYLKSNGFSKISLITELERKEKR